MASSCVFVICGAAQSLPSVRGGGKNLLIFVGGVVLTNVNPPVSCADSPLYTRGPLDRQIPIYQAAKPTSTSVNMPVPFWGGSCLCCDCGNIQPGAELLRVDIGQIPPHCVYRCGGIDLFSVCFVVFYPGKQHYCAL